MKEIENRAFKTGIARMTTNELRECWELIHRMKPHEPTMAGVAFQAWLLDSVFQVEIVVDKTKVRPLYANRCM